MRGYYGRQASWIGIEAYGVPPSTTRSGPYNDVAPLRKQALAAATGVYAGTGNPNIGYRYTPWGSETVAFGTLAGLQRWMNEQGNDADVWYATTFNFLAKQPRTGEIAR